SHRWRVVRSTPAASAAAEMVLPVSSAARAAACVGESVGVAFCCTMSLPSVGKGHGPSPGSLPAAAFGTPTGRLRLNFSGSPSSSHRPPHQGVEQSSHHARIAPVGAAYSRSLRDEPLPLTTPPGAAPPATSVRRPRAVPPPGGSASTLLVLLSGGCLQTSLNPVHSRTHFANNYTNDAQTHPASACHPPRPRSRRGAGAVPAPAVSTSAFSPAVQLLTRGFGGVGRSRA